MNDMFVPVMLSKDKNSGPQSHHENQLQMQYMSG